jgi:glc operon protein GlcG
MRTLNEITHCEAARIVAAIRAELESEGRGAAVAVVDPHGELIAFLRTDGCPLPSIDNAMHKAFTAAREASPSASIGEKSRSEGFPITNFGDLRYTGWGGGIPLIVDDQVIGAVGVSGLPEAEDIALAQLGAAVVVDEVATQG